jgi:hypothetical protein
MIKWIWTNPGSPEMQSIAEKAIALLYLAKKSVESEEYTHADYTATKGEEYHNFINQEYVKVEEGRFVIVIDEESGEILRPLGRSKLLALGYEQCHENPEEDYYEDHLNYQGNNTHYYRDQEEVDYQEEAYYRQEPPRRQRYYEESMNAYTTGEVEYATKCVQIIDKLTKML